MCSVLAIALLHLPDDGRNRRRVNARAPHQLNCSPYVIGIDCIEELFHHVDRGELL